MAPAERERSANFISSPARSGSAWRNFAVSPWNFAVISTLMTEIPPCRSLQKPRGAQCYRSAHVQLPPGSAGSRWIYDRVSSCYLSCSAGQGFLAGDQGERCGRCLFGGGLRGVVARAEGAIEYQHGVAVGGRDDGGGEPRSGPFVAVDQPGRRGQEGHPDCLCGALDFRVTALVQPGPGQGLEQRPLIGGEPDVGPGRGGEPLSRGSGCGLAVELLTEELSSPDRDSGPQGVAMGGVPGWRGHRHAQAAACLGHGERLDAALAQQFDGGLDQRRPQITVVIPPAFSRSRPDFAGPGHCGTGNGTMRRMNASQPRSPRRRRAIGATRACEPTL